MTAPVVAGDKRMTVREVAEALGTAESTIRNKARELFPETVENGKATYLNEEQVFRLKKALVPRDLTLKSKVDSALSALEIEEMTLKVISYHKAEADRLRADLAAAAPKVEFFDTVANSKDAITMRDVAAALNIPGWGRNQIFAFLRDWGILDDRNIPYREYQDRGYFRVVERTWSDPKGETHIALTTLVYQKGVDFIRRTIKEPVRGGAQA